MKNSIHKESNIKTIWFQKTCDLTHGYGYHIQIYWKRYCHILERMVYSHLVTYGFSKNKFTALRQALDKKGNKL